MFNFRPHPFGDFAEKFLVRPGQLSSSLWQRLFHSYLLEYHASNRCQ